MTPRSLEQLIYVDDATELYNTRYLNHVLNDEINHSQVTQESFAILFIDVDHFKAINDRYGHLHGTRLLKQLGAQINSCIRDSDRVFRYGGDEFIVLLSPCDLILAEGVANRIRESIQKKIFYFHEEKTAQVTVSIGVALYPEHAQSFDGILEAADLAMYQAKKGERNRVEISR